jgi:hypothetical protein
MIKLHNEINKRSETKYVVLTQCRSLYEQNAYISNDALLGGTYKCTWIEWQKYWYYHTDHRKIPCHYFCEFLDDNYVIYIGNPLVNRSYFLEDLADARIIPERYRNALLISLSDDFRMTFPDKEMLNNLADKLLSTLMCEFPIDENSIVLLDDILTSDYDFALKENNLTYDIQPMTKFNMMELKVILKNYRKGIKRPMNFTGKFSG